MITQIRIAQYYKLISLGDIEYRENTYFKLQIGVDGVWSDVPTVYIEEGSQEIDRDDTNVIEFKPK